MISLEIFIETVVVNLCTIFPLLYWHAVITESAGVCEYNMTDLMPRDLTSGHAVNSEITKEFDVN